MAMIEPGRLMEYLTKFLTIKYVNADKRRKHVKGQNIYAVVILYIRLMEDPKDAWGPIVVSPYGTAMSSTPGADCPQADLAFKWDADFTQFASLPTKTCSSVKKLHSSHWQLLRSD